jgi:fructose-1,6-bisphosphatase/inositol monophosphatase family enzyme
MQIDTDAISKKIIEVSENHMLPRYERLKEHEVTSKTNPRDLVTAADIETEKSLGEYLLKKYPGSHIIGEEAFSRGEVDLKALSLSEGMVWVIDPIDGTYNFVRGGKDFAVMLSCIVGGKNLYGWIYDILEGGFGYAERGEGAWYKGIRANVSCREIASESKGHINIRYFPKSARKHIEKEAQKTTNYFSLGSTAKEYLRIASGISDYAVYSRAKPWDHLAGTLMVEEAGGVVRRWDGDPYIPGDMKSGLLVAASEPLWQELHETFISPVIQEQA